jgi:hypothetical protein
MTASSLLLLGWFCAGVTAFVPMGGSFVSASARSQGLVARRSGHVLGQSLQRSGRASASLGLRMGNHVQVVNSEELEVAIQVKASGIVIIMGVS